MPNKWRERWYVEQMKVAFADFPHGEVRSGESPDFIVNSDSGDIGIEVTVIHLPPLSGQRLHQELQALKDQVVARASQIHADSGGPALYVSVYFRDPVSITMQQVQDLAKCLAAAVGDALVPTSFDEPAVTLPWSRLPQGVAEVSIHASINGSDQLWQADAGGWVAPVGKKDVEAVIQRKAMMANVARSKCTEVWLAIVNDAFSNAAPAELAAEAVRGRYEHPFHRLLWVEPHIPRVRELR